MTTAPLKQGLSNADPKPMKVRLPDLHSLPNRLRAKLLGLSLLLCFAATPLCRAGDHLPYQFKVPTGWSAFQAPSVDAAWTPSAQKDAKSKTVTLLVHTKKNSKPYEFKGAARARLIEIVQKTRGYLLRLAGLSDWTIDESTTEELQGGKALRIRLRGHYRGVKEQPVEFHEWAYFIGDRYYQFSYHQPPLTGDAAQGRPSAANGLSPAEADSLLATFVPEGL